MGMLDASLQFSNAQAITATAQSTNFYDLLTGASGTTTYATAPANIIPITETSFGEDLGIGKGPGTPRIIGSVIQAFNNLTTLQVQFQGGPQDAGNSGNRSAVTFATYIQTDTIALALLTANTRIFSFDWPMRKIAQALPRFVQLNYVVVGTAPTAGTVTADVTLGDDDATNTLQQYGRNFSVAS
jgi:hypothetical protein